MFYEFSENLRKLDDISGKDKIKIVVKVHPSQDHCIELLKKTYKNLIFSRKKIEMLFKKSYATITFSSSVIEDSLNSKIPVIIEPSGYHAILSGIGKSEPILEFLPENHTVQFGNKVYTSGKEGIFSPGIPIGEVNMNTENILVSLFSDLTQITFVNINLGVSNN